MMNDEMIDANARIYRAINELIDALDCADQIESLDDDMMNLRFALMNAR